MSRLFLLIPFLVLGCASAQEGNLVRVSEIAPGVLQDMQYFGSDNFLGRPVAGYEAPECILSLQAAQALSQAQDVAADRGYSLLVYDCYRPQRAVDDFVGWSEDPADTTAKAAYYPDIPKSELFDQGYIAARSGHSRASTVDLTLSRDGSALEMGTAYDFFGEASHTDHPATDSTARANRDRLRTIMTEAGFRNYSQEWWHYTLIDEPYPETYFDRPVR